MAYWSLLCCLFSVHMHQTDIHSLIHYDLLSMIDRKIKKTAVSVYVCASVCACVCVYILLSTSLSFLYLENILIFFWGSLQSLSYLSGSGGNPYFAENWTM